MGDNLLYALQSELIDLDSSVTTALAGKANTSHTHTKADVTDFAHTHPISDVTSLQTTLDAKADEVASPSFTAPTLLNSWVNFGGALQSAGYYKDAFGFVHLRGLIKDGTTTTGTVLFNLPTGFRPTATELFGINNSNALGRVDVQAGGDVVHQAGGNTFLTLSGISFAVA